jgi:molecular chaperone GrpE
MSEQDKSEKEAPKFNAQALISRLVSATTLFKGFATSDVEALIAVSKKVKFTAGQDLFLTCDAAKEMFVHLLHQIIARLFIGKIETVLVDQHLLLLEPLLPRFFRNVLEDALAELAQVKATNADLADQFLRAKAEAENARRRAEEEISKARKFAVEAFAESLLPVADSLAAGLAIADASAEQLREGSEATLRQLKSALERHKVIEINPEAGAKFDPHQHQAISVVPAEQEPNTVVSVLQKGYLIADRVLRPALVTVTAPK